MLAADPDTTGSLGMAISEAVEAAANDPEAHYSLGSVLNHVLLHQTVIGVEALAQLDELGEQRRHRLRLRRRRIQPRRTVVPVPRPQPARRYGDRRSWPASRRPARR